MLAQITSNYQCRIDTYAITSSGLSEGPVDTIPVPIGAIGISPVTVNGDLQVVVAFNSATDKYVPVMATLHREVFDRVLFISIPPLETTDLHVTSNRIMTKINKGVVVALAILFEDSSMLDIKDIPPQCLFDIPNPDGSGCTPIAHSRLLASSESSSAASDASSARRARGVAGGCSNGLSVSYLAFSKRFIIMAESYFIVIGIVPVRFYIDAFINVGISVNGNLCFVERTVSVSVVPQAALQAVAGGEVYLFVIAAGVKIQVRLLLFPECCGCSPERCVRYLNNAIRFLCFPFRLEALGCTLSLSHNVCRVRVSFAPQATFMDSQLIGMLTLGLPDGHISACLTLTLQIQPLTVEK